MCRNLYRLLLAVIPSLTATEAFAAEAGPPHLDGATLGAAWAMPFIALLLSIAILPLAAPQLWRRRYGVITAAWSLLFLIPFAVLYGPELATSEFLHVMLLDYLSFIILIFATYVISGGVFLEGELRGTPAVNTVMLAAGTALGSLTGTIGASILLIRPLLRANAGRKHVAHVVVFFIFLVSNVGGSLTPLGPPLYMGILRGIDFFWPAQHLWRMAGLVTVVLLAAFFVVDTLLSERTATKPSGDAPARPPLRLRGWRNVPFLLGVPAAILGSAWWQTSAAIEVYGVAVPYPDIARSLFLLLMAAISLMFTPISYRTANGFSWGPVNEVAKLFAGIFVTMVPVLAMLRAGDQGAFRDVLATLTLPDGQPNNAMYFWLSGGLSSFLDNAPTYLVFLSAAGGDPQQLMGPLAATLAAISAGSSFMGANTYIGNAPNFMVKAIAEEAGVKMPSFFGFMLWSFAFCLPTFALVTWLYFL